MAGFTSRRSAGKWGQEYNFYYTKWTEDGEEKYAYVVPVHTTKNGLDWDYEEVYTPIVDRNGKETLSVSYLYYRPEALAEGSNGGRDFYVVESIQDGKRLVQVMRTIDGYPDDFENVFIGIAGLNGQTINITNVYPEVAYISTTDKKKHQGGASISYVSNPACYVTKLDLRVVKNWLKKFRTKMTRPDAFGHELGHVRQHHDALATSIEAGRKELKQSGDPFPAMYTSYILPILIEQMITNLPKLSEGNLRSLYAGSALVLGNTVVGGNTWMKIEETAELESKLFIQTCRSRGIDLFDGIPDSQLPLFINSTLMKAVMHFYDVATKPKIPLDSLAQLTKGH